MRQRVAQVGSARTAKTASAGAWMIVVALMVSSAMAVASL